MILVACSKRKNNRIRGQARYVYTGALFRMSMEYIDKLDLPCRILSAKYGWIHPHTLIEPYDETIDGYYRGPFPDSSGHYIGGQRYFKYAPERFQPLLHSTAGLKAYLAELRYLIDNRIEPCH